MENKSKYDKHTVEIQEAEDANQRDLTDAWAEIGGQVEQDRLDDEARAHPLEQYDSDDPSCQQVDIVQSPGSATPVESNHGVEFNTIDMPHEEHLALVPSLSQKQKLIHDFVFDWCWQSKLFANTN